MFVILRFVGWLHSRQVSVVMVQGGARRARGSRPTPRSRAVGPGNGVMVPNTTRAREQKMLLHPPRGCCIIAPPDHPRATGAGRFLRERREAAMVSRSACSTTTIPLDRRQVPTRLVGEVSLRSPRLGNPVQRRTATYHYVARTCWKRIPHYARAFPSTQSEDPVPEPERRRHGAGHQERRRAARHRGASGSDRAARRTATTGGGMGGPRATGAPAAGRPTSSRGVASVA